ncbi:HAD-IIB family hydrolase [Bacillus sp. WMMC1349]|uniref:HAD-IIB family hydrolase n=1 Tax=Bacillus sp. WMMC1349 TaxID=2736254 RepID=UPI00155544D8|nr:HAD-IIB family hydrolase [Bacillus sp. WMMC1349]NPC94174.1 HAD-IIB family hydrolase [Bacillus sp. WMMC1349]
MSYHETLSFHNLEQVDKPKYAVFCDFDETYFAHSITDESRKALIDLETFIHSHHLDKKILLGWVTGSSLSAVLTKMKRGGFRYLPHFIASNLGTEITFFSKEGQIPDNEWEERLRQSGFTYETVKQLKNILDEKYGITLIPQTQHGYSGYKVNYYYTSVNESADQRALDVIRDLAAEHQIGVNINRCNPLAGDPENSYDVDFIPLQTGKPYIVDFILEQFKIRKEHSFAFGDSGNDVEMLKKVDHGYLVGNATAEAKLLHSRITQGSYTTGILEVLKAHIQ